MTRPFVIAFAFTLAIGPVTGFAQPAANVTLTQPATPAPAVPADVAAVRRAVPGPCQDYFWHINADWIKNTPLPVEVPDTSVHEWIKRDTIRVDNFTTLDKQTRVVLLDILHKARAEMSTTTDPVTRVLGTFYNSCMVGAPPPVTRTAKKEFEKEGLDVRCLMGTDSVLGNALGRAYVSRVLSPTTKARVLELAEQLRNAMETRLKANPWMSAATKQAALTKLAKMTFKVGNPEQGDDYNALTLSPTDYMSNRQAAQYVGYHRDVNAVGAAEPDKSLWTFRQYTVNAMYNPTNNSLEVPTVLFQPPFFDTTKVAPENYAAVGYVMGHEITHAFDTYGSQYNEKGQPQNWWTSEDAATFAQRTQKLADQFNKFTILDTVHVNGNLTLNENIADLGGFNIAYDAYKQAAAKNLALGAGDADRRFFEAFGTVWRRISSDKFAQQQVVRDVHAPNHWRVNGVLANFQPFAKTYGCKAGDPMVQSDADRVVVW